ncbi:diphthine-ammonia ligase [Bacillus sp. SORGH_AS 510]|uniref:Dph6-related ATP pyrophosphatase n=1 Tax=Bacillus sp. SORGH_AS_0510 TaxID=3041771 RepID=UPI002784C22D|nr:diphthine--ammonia ligase [Bacillus sp. SORGH_AS_0510]MDQ1145709.1 diphthine-ammonia ligase [Bacillus sp. SORGH_AS_0510]
MKKRIALSWSGGKDCCMALDTLIKIGYEVACLVTTVPKELGRTFGHGERTEMIKLQGAALSIPVHFIQCSYDTYTDQFVKALSNLKKQYKITGIAYGDLYLEAHRNWGEKVADDAGVESFYPLWSQKEEALKLLRNFVQSGYKAVVVRVRENVLDETWLGRCLDESFLHDVNRTTICPMGESGEYHTFVYDGPLFSKGIQLLPGEIIQLETTKKLEFMSYQLVD